MSKINPSIEEFLNEDLFSKHTPQKRYLEKRSIFNMKHILNQTPQKRYLEKMCIFQIVQIEVK